MTRVLVIGNSHSAALRYAWDSLAQDYPHIDLRFFVVGGPLYYSFDLNADGIFCCLSPDDLSAETRDKLRKRNGSESIDCNEADEVVLIGRAYGEEEIAALCGRWSVDGLATATDKEPLSAAAFMAVCNDLATAYLPNPHWGRLRGRTYFAGAPRAAESLCTAQSFLGGARPWRSVASRPHGYWAAAETYDQLFAQRLSTVNVGFVLQPTDTLGETGLTRTEFLRFSPDTPMQDGSVPADDYRHMNEAFGSIRLRTMICDHFGLSKAPTP